MKVKFLLLLFVLALASCPGVTAGPQPGDLLPDGVEPGKLVPDVDPGDIGGTQPRDLLPDGIEPGRIVPEDPTDLVPTDLDPNDLLPDGVDLGGGTCEGPHVGPVCLPEDSVVCSEAGMSGGYIAAVGPYQSTGATVGAPDGPYAGAGYKEDGTCPGPLGR